MVLETASVGKLFRTMRAVESVGAVVGVEVGLETLLVGELLGADGTLEDLGAGVHLHVELEAGHVGEGLVAHGADEGLGVVVHVHVPHVVPPGDEALAADAAAVLRQVSVVLTLVVRQTRAGFELGLAHPALERQGARLVPAGLGQQGSSLEPLCRQLPARQQGGGCGWATHPHSLR